MFDPLSTVENDALGEVDADEKEHSGGRLVTNRFVI